MYFAFMSMIVSNFRLFSPTLRGGISAEINSFIFRIHIQPIIFN